MNELSELREMTKATWCMVIGAGVMDYIVASGLRNSIVAKPISYFLALPNSEQQVMVWTITTLHSLMWEFWVSFSYDIR